MPPEAVRKAMLDEGRHGWPDHIEALMGLAARGGMFRDTDDVATLTGHEPRRLADWTGANRGTFTG